jgi:hypothetical protein
VQSPFHFTTPERSKQRRTFNQLRHEKEQRTKNNLQLLQQRKYKQTRQSATTTTTSTGSNGSNNDHNHHGRRQKEEESYRPNQRSSGVSYPLLLSSPAILSCYNIL